MRQAWAWKSVLSILVSVSAFCQRGSRAFSIDDFELSWLQQHELPFATTILSSLLYLIRQLDVVLQCLMRLRKDQHSFIVKLWSV